MSKVCNTCGIEKELTSFHVTKNNKDGHKGKCKACCTKYYRERSGAYDEARPRTNYMKRAKEAKKRVEYDSDVLECMDTQLNNMSEREAYELFEGSL